MLHGVTVCGRNHLMDARVFRAFCALTSRVLNYHPMKGGWTRLFFFFCILFSMQQGEKSTVFCCRRLSQTLIGGAPVRRVVFEGSHSWSGHRGNACPRKGASRVCWCLQHACPYEFSRCVLLSVIVTVVWLPSTNWVCFPSWGRLSCKA